MAIVNKTAIDLLEGGVKKLHSNQAINGAFDFLAAGGQNAIRFGKEAMSQGSLTKAAKTVYQDDAGKWMYGNIAGSYIAASAATRIATGGGLYRDGNGNNDIIGIPGI